MRGSKKDSLANVKRFGSKEQERELRESQINRPTYLYQSTEQIRKMRLTLREASSP